MRFIRPRVVVREANGILPSGEQATKVAQDVAWLDPDVDQTGAPTGITLRRPRDIPSAVLTGTAQTVDVPYVDYSGGRLEDAPTKIFQDVPTVILPASYPTVEPGNAEFSDVQLAALNEQAVFFANLNGHRLILLHVNVANLGGATDVRFLMEFEDPDFPNNWIPSKESAPGTPDRDDITDASNEWIATAVGSYLFQTREEHRGFRRFRVRCRRNGAMSAAGRVDIGYFHDGGRATVPEQ